MKKNVALTSLLSGRIVEKCSVPIEAVGLLEEVASHIGLVKIYANRIWWHSQWADSPERNHLDHSLLQSIYKELYQICVAVSSDNRADEIYLVAAKTCHKMEEQSELIMRVLPKSFSWVDYVVPQAQFDIARAVTRRAERFFVAHYDEYPSVCAYLNSLSKYLFAIMKKLEYRE